jgi:ketosteroid isomerase-like protein
LGGNLPKDNHILVYRLSQWLVWLREQSVFRVNSDSETCLPFPQSLKKTRPSREKQAAYSKTSAFVLPAAHVCSTNPAKPMKTKNPMKTNLLLALILVATALTATTVRAQSSPETSGRDETAIRAVVEGSRTAFDKRDMTAFAANFLNSPDLYYQILTGDQQMLVANGMENMKKMVGGYFKAMPTPATPGSYAVTDVRVRVRGNTAYVTGNGEESKAMSRDFMTLEKTDGVWKITSLIGTYYGTGKFTEVK